MALKAQAHPNRSFYLFYMFLIGQGLVASLPLQTVGLRLRLAGQAKREVQQSCEPNQVNHKYISFVKHYIGRYRPLYAWTKVLRLVGLLGLEKLIGRSITASYGFSRS